MRLDKEDQTTKTPIQSPLLDLVVAPHLEQISDENKTAHSVSESHSPSRDDYTFPRRHSPASDRFAHGCHRPQTIARSALPLSKNGSVWATCRRVAHDFNNFLTTILGYGDLLLHERQIKGTLADHVTEIRAAAGRASALTQQLLAFSRRQPLEPVIVEVNSIITNFERSLLRLIGENISVVCHLHHEKEGAHIKADPSQITQIILNLAVNARDAMPKGGQLTLETAIVDLTKEMESPFLCGDFVSGHYVLIKIADNGIGMSEEVKAHLFEPFFTTKTDQERSGLGLATCYGIVHQSGGHLRVESDLGKGTVVQI